MVNLLEDMRFTTEQIDEMERLNGARDNLRSAIEQTKREEVHGTCG